MTDSVRKIYKSALRNEKFLSAIKEADNDDKPDGFDHNEKIIFASVYYGWLVAEHGITWELHL